MPPTRGKGKTLLLALLWALSFTALCVTLAPSQTSTEHATVSWARTLPGTGAWFLAAVALGLGYRFLGRLHRAFIQPRLWLAALLLAGVATLGESFAQTGTTGLITSQKALAALYFAGRVPAYYMGMVLLLEALSRPCAASEAGSAVSAAGYPSQRAGKAAVSAKAARFTAEPASLRVGQPYATGDTQRQTIPQGATAAAGDYRRNVTAVASAPAYRETAAQPPARPTATGALPAAAPFSPPTWVFMLALLICWLPYLFAIWPGTVSNDSITQLAEIFGRKPLSNGNPVFQTGLVWLAMVVGKGLFHSSDAAVALYACTQAVLMAWLLGYALGRMAETRAPRWLIGLATAFYALCPVFPIFAFCMGKDTVFAMAVLWFTLMVWRVVTSKWPPLRTVVGLCMSAVLCALLRNAGVLLAGVTLLALLIWALTRGTRQWRAPLLSLLLLGAAVLALNLAVLPRLAAAPTPETENWSVPLQQVARVVASESLTDGERAAIDAVMPIDQLQPAYNGELSDPVKALWRDGVTADQKAAFFGTWARLGLKYPATYLSATFHNSYGYLLPGYVSTIKPTFLLGMEGRTTLIDGAFDFTVNPRANELKASLQALFPFAPFRLLTAPGAYGLLTLFAIAAMMSLQKRANALCMLPALFTLIGCLFSAVNGYYRYAMPLYFAAPVLLALLSQAAHSGLRGQRQP